MMIRILVGRRRRVHYYSHSAGRNGYYIDDLLKTGEKRQVQQEPKRCLMSMVHQHQLKIHLKADLKSRLL